ncbi:MAG: hypothetical protein U9N62_03000 [Thermotogota bacterium]|nr:hypothetical protein [Thermotogota bacterium]
MAHEQLLDDVKKMHNDYLKLSEEQRHFLSTRLKARIKLRFKMDLLKKSNDKKKLEKTIHRNINTTYKVSWSRINSLPYDKEKNAIELYRSWLFNISLDILLLKLINGHKESGMKEFYRIYNLPVKSYIAKNLYGKKGTEYFNIKCHDLLMETFQRFERYIANFSPFKGALFSYLISIADHLIKDQTAESETLVSEFNEHDEEERGRVFWAVSSDPSPDQLQEKSTFERYLLEQIINEGGYPWQVLVVLFIKTTNNRPDITKLEDLTISELYQKMIQEFTNCSFHEEKELAELFKPLETQLNRHLSEIIPTKDHRSRIHLENHLSNRLGELPLKVFFGKDPLKNIRDWNHRIFKRVRKKVLED